MNVLLTCVGLRVDVVQAFRDAVARMGGGLVVGTDASAIAPALPFCDVQVEAPPASDPGYADHVLATARDHDCAMVLPCSEWDLVLLADLAPRLAEQGCTAFIPDGEATRRCVDKLAMARFLEERGLGTPRTYAPDALPDDLRYQVEQYDERQRRRLDVKPGVTGWAQVNGRASVPWPERIEMDVWYVEHQSLRLDAEIVARTIGTLLSRDGTYKGPAGGWQPGGGA